MAYKARFRPLQGRIGGQWQTLTDTDIAQLE
jgi:arginyl-tRNA--protein-N-Asp/Glu arginylyltransferase